MAFLNLMLLCSCPPGTALTDIPNVTCPDGVGQVQKIIFQRLYSSGTTKNKFTIATDDPAALASWTALKTATDSTKVTVSPFVAQPEMDANAPREYGGGNATVGGIPIILGAEPSPFKCRIINTRQDVIEAMKEYQCETLAVYLVDEFGKIWGLADDVASATTFSPIPVQQFFITDKVLGGYDEPDYNEMRFSFKAGWSDKLYGVTPTDFDALTDI